MEYKAKEFGIEVEYISEVYTSGVDSSEEGAVSKETYTPEARIKRGLYKRGIETDKAKDIFQA